MLDPHVIQRPETGAAHGNTPLWPVCGTGRPKSFHLSHILFLHSQVGEADIDARILQGRVSTVSL